ncbi:MAG: 1-deoxy-D-xylulose-5-phosphate synthase [Gammaproteobacteria bacterium]|nr:1-deoxy-D-xylulose-5-phosphate synthase [Gammaproteobacteria bacterium]
MFTIMKSSVPMLLKRIDSPQDLRGLPQDELGQLATELRSYLLHSVSRSGGHFAAGLGAIELTVALHYVFNTPYDRLVWDVGHQCYPHKILTGRRDEIGTIRQQGGLAPFPKREESEYDSFDVGHSSTSISAGLGMALASALKKEDRKTVAIIGDGAMTAGMAYEALNHLGDAYADLLVVLNDNEMSISPNVGAMTNYLTRMLSGKVYSSMREGGKRLLKQMPPMWELARRTEEHVKGMIAPGTLFEEMGINYFGPVDGHDLSGLIQTLFNLKQHQGPRLLHVVTRKGKGYEPAEADPVGYHAVSQFDPEIGVVKSSKPSKPTYTQIFGDWLCDMAERDKRLIGITPAMQEGSGMVRFAEQFPDRYYDVGIAEQHSVTLAAGLACGGMKPVVAIYSTFLQRAYDQLIHDVALQNLPVLFAIDRAGVVGPDGPTHSGSFDLSYMRCIPNMIIMAPADENECRQMLYTGFLQDVPVAVRYPRGKGPGVEVKQQLQALPIGKARILRKGREVAFLGFGAPVYAALEAAASLKATAVDMRFIKPLDEQMVCSMAETHELLVTVEDNAVEGGAASAVNDYLIRNNIQVEVLNLGLPDQFFSHGSREQLLAQAKLDSQGLLKAVRDLLNRRDCTSRNTQVISQ